MADYTGNTIWLSSSPADDMPQPGEDRGWVSSFHRDLSLRIRMLTPLPPRVYAEDLEGTGESEPDDEDLLNRAVMVVLLSEAMMEEDLPMEHFQQFVQRRLPERLDPSEPVPLFPVPIQPFDEELLPPPSQDLLRYSFLAETEGSTARLDRQRDADRYWTCIDDLAHDLLDSLAPSASPLRVYLAEMPAGGDELRRRVHRQIQSLGCRVLPTTRLPRRLKHLRQILPGLMSKIDLYIRFDTGEADPPLRGSTEGLGRLQDLAAIEASRERDMTHLIWRPGASGLEWRDPESDPFTTDRLEQAEWIVGSMEDLIHSVSQHVDARHPAAPIQTS